MGARKVTVTVECCDPDTGDMDITVEDPGNPEPEWRYQELTLHPAVFTLVNELMDIRVTKGTCTRGSISLNKPESGA